MTPQLRNARTRRLSWWNGLMLVVASKTCLLYHLRPLLRRLLLPASRPANVPTVPSESSSRPLNYLRTSLRPKFHGIPIYSLAISMGNVKQRKLSEPWPHGFPPWRTARIRRNVRMAQWMTKRVPLKANALLIWYQDFLQYLAMRNSTGRF
jgi:hypothetical protein